MYVNNSLNYTILEKTSNEAFQALWIEIDFLHCKNIICGVIYRQHIKWVQWELAPEYWHGATRRHRKERRGRVKLYGKRLKRHPRPKLKVGDRVRLSKKHPPFKKGYLPGCTEEVFIVQRVVPGSMVTYKLEEWDGAPLGGSFYEQDVQKVTVPDDALFRMEKILQRRGQAVKVPYDSWVPRSAFTCV